MWIKTRLYIRYSCINDTIKTLIPACVVYGHHARLPFKLEPGFNPWLNHYTFAIIGEKDLPLH